MNYCPKCGRHINDDDNFCPNCGYDLVGKKETYTYVYRQEKIIDESEEKPYIHNKKECKSKVVAALLQMLLSFGIGRFYLGYKDMAVAQLVLTLFGIGIIWTFIDGIYILLDGVSKDAKGVPLR